MANFRDASGPAPCRIEPLPHLRAPEDPLRAYRCRGGSLKQGLLYRTGHWVTATASDLATLRDVVQLKTYLDLRNGQDFESVDACLGETLGLVLGPALGPEHMFHEFI